MTHQMKLLAFDWSTAIQGVSVTFARQKKRIPTSALLCALITKENETTMT